MMNNTVKTVIMLLTTLAILPCLTACSTASNNQFDNRGGAALIIGASPSPHAEILQVVKPILEKQGIKLTIKEFSDYILPNTALVDGSLDGNFFQHKPYMDKFNIENKADLVAVANIHFEPMGIYGGKSTDLKTIPKGAQISVPNDLSNQARALQLLQKVGIITLKPGLGLLATKNDMIENPHDIKLVEVEAAQVARTLQDVDFAVVNGNFALLAEITDSVLEAETPDSEGAKQFPNVLAVRKGNQNNENIKALVQALTSTQVKAFITEKYGASVVPLF